MPQLHGYARPISDGAIYPAINHLTKAGAITDPYRISAVASDRAERAWLREQLDLPAEQGEGGNTQMTPTMRAAVLDAPGPVTNFHIRDLPIPEPESGWVRIRVKAFGLNRSELLTRQGLSGDAVTFPRVLGIEATGVVDDDPSGTFTQGQKVMTMMGGMGRAYDGGYAEYTCVPLGQVIAFTSDADWATLGAIPEMLQTAYGSLTTGLDVKPGRSILIRGGTSSVGMAAAILAKRLGMTVLSTTRSSAKADPLIRMGVDHVLIDNGHVAQQVRQIIPSGADTALELVGTPTLHDTLRAVRVHGVVCFTGMLSGEWIVKDFYPIEYIPRGVRLTAYSGEASDLPAEVLQGFLDDVAAGEATVPIDTIYSLDQIREAHTRMEEGTATGKLVVLTERIEEVRPVPAAVPGASTEPSSCPMPGLPRCTTEAQ